MSVPARAALLLILVVAVTGLATSGSLAQEDAAIEAELDRIARETATLRDLPPLAEIDDVLLSRNELLAMLPRLIAEEVDPAEAAAQSRAFAALGLIPEGIDLVDLSVRLMGEQAAGFYDPVTDEMTVVYDGELGAEEYYYAHEVVHALQDAHLDERDRMEDLSDLSGDAALAALALYEGDAVMVSDDYLASHPALALAILGEIGFSFPVLEQAPAAIGVNLLFPYTSGADFVGRLRAEGGWEAVDAAYADVPASTEQILHPGKYLDGDEPAPVMLPNPVDALGEGWRTVHEDTLGELQTGILLAQLAPGEGFDAITGAITLPEAARNAAAGWDGDRFALWEDAAGARETVVWRTVWDTPRDARAFSRALANLGEERWGGIFNGESPDDVALVMPEIAARILLIDSDVFYVQSPDLALTDVVLAAMQSTPVP
jgi:hypothetical protein